MQSCIYRGWVRHRRFEPVRNAFRYQLFFVWIDLDEVNDVFRGRWLWSASRPAMARFRRSDHLGPPEQPLRESVADLVERDTGRRPTGPIRVLTQLRFFGYLMNPVAFYYCFDRSGTVVESVVAEVTNTPWGQRHCYVLDAVTVQGHGPDTPKEFHVSPFMDMNQSYAWQVGMPGERLDMHINVRKPAPARSFDVTMALSRHEITTRTLASTLLRHPFMTGRIAAAIYWQALKLWWKGCPFVPHPDSQSQPGDAKPQNQTSLDSPQATVDPTSDATVAAGSLEYHS